MALTLVETHASLSGTGLINSAAGTFEFWAWTFVSKPASAASRPNSSQRIQVYGAGITTPFNSTTGINLYGVPRKIWLLQRTDGGTERLNAELPVAGIPFTGLYYYLQPDWVATLTMWNR